MSFMDRTERVRKLVDQQLQLLGSHCQEAPRETLLIRDGYFCGRRFDRDGYEAVWFEEERQIKFFDPHGVLLAVHEDASQLEPQTRRAA